MEHGQCYYGAALSVALPKLSQIIPVCIYEITEAMSKSNQFNVSNIAQVLKLNKYVRYYLKQAMLSILSYFNDLFLSAETNKWNLV